MYHKHPSSLSPFTPRPLLILNKKVVILFYHPHIISHYVNAVRAGGAYRGDQVLAFLPRIPSLIRSQPVGFSLTGLALQFADALVFVFLVR